MKKSLVNESLKDLRNFKRILKEAYGDMGGDMENQGPRMMQQQGQQMAAQQNGYDDEEMIEQGDEQPMEDKPMMDGIIDQIRQLAIKGIAQYADDIESEKYQALKKIWLLTDKFYEEMVEGEDEKKKKF